MIKSLSIDNNHSIDVNSSIGWLLIYRETFGRDILPDIMPVIDAVITGAVDILEETDGDYSTKAIVKAMGSGAMSNTMTSISTLEFVTIIKILWAMAKNADNTIPDVYKWASQFDVFPLDEIAPELFKLLTESMVSSKNLKRLENLMHDLRNQ